MNKLVSDRLFLKFLSVVVKEWLSVDVHLAAKLIDVVVSKILYYVTLDVMLITTVAAINKVIKQLKFCYFIAI